MREWLHTLRQHKGGLVLVASLLLVALAISLFLIPGMGFSAVSFLVSLLFWGITGYLAFRRHRSGTTLLDLGRSEDAGISGGIGALWIILGLWNLLASDQHQAAQSVLDFGVATIWLGQAVYSRNQLREQGIVSGLRTIPWACVDSYILDDEYDVSGDIAVMQHLFLLIKIRSRWMARPRWLNAWLNSITIRCSLSDRNAIMQIMVEHVVLSNGKKRLGSHL